MPRLHRVRSTRLLAAGCRRCVHRRPGQARLRSVLEDEILAGTRRLCNRRCRLFLLGRGRPHGRSALLVFLRRLLLHLHLDVILLSLCLLHLCFHLLSLCFLLLHPRVASLGEEAIYALLRPLRRSFRLLRRRSRLRRILGGGTFGSLLSPSSLHFNFRLDLRRGFGVVDVGVGVNVHLVAFLAARRFLRRSLLCRRLRRRLLRSCLLRCGLRRSLCSLGRRRRGLGLVARLVRLQKGTLPALLHVRLRRLLRVLLLLRRLLLRLRLLLCVAVVLLLVVLLLLRLLVAAAAAAAATSRRRRRRDQHRHLHHRDLLPQDRKQLRHNNALQLRSCDRRLQRLLKPVALRVQRAELCVAHVQAPQEAESLTRRPRAGDELLVRPLQRRQQRLVQRQHGQQRRRVRRLAVCARARLLEEGAEVAPQLHGELQRVEALVDALRAQLPPPLRPLLARQRLEHPHPHRVHGGRRAAVAAAGVFAAGRRRHEGIHRILQKAVQIGDEFRGGVACVRRQTLERTRLHRLDVQPHRAAVRFAHTQARRRSVADDGVQRVGLLLLGKLLRLLSLLRLLRLLLLLLPLVGRGRHSRAGLLLGGFRVQHRLLRDEGACQEAGGKLAQVVEDARVVGQHPNRLGLHAPRESQRRHHLPHERRRPVFVVLQVGCGHDRGLGSLVLLLHSQLQPGEVLLAPLAERRVEAAGAERGGCEEHGGHACQHGEEHHTLHRKAGKSLAHLRQVPAAHRAEVTRDGEGRRVGVAACVLPARHVHVRRRHRAAQPRHEQPLLQLAHDCSGLRNVQVVRGALCALRFRVLLVGLTLLQQRHRHLVRPGRTRHNELHLRRLPGGHLAHVRPRKPHALLHLAGDAAHADQVRLLRLSVLLRRLSGRFLRLLDRHPQRRARIERLA
eukprot:Rhum_TRINITY_DN15083_c0_g1::Rhum_TRINITY_DN15083_c0_g1_i1::g.136345::m.136345